MKVPARSLLACLGVALFVAHGCSPSVGGPVGARLGAPCDQLLPCEGALLCVDGRCLERPWPSDPSTADTTPAPIEIAVVGDVEGDAQRGDAVDAVDSGSPLTEDGLDDGAGGAAVLVFIGVHGAASAPSDDTLTLQAEQAAVAQLFLPATGAPRALEVLAKDPINSEGCGYYHPALWVASVDGQFPPEPSWRGEAVVVGGEATLQQIALEGAPELSAGGIRVGLIFEALCPGSSRQPIFVTDTSGQVDGTWVWVNLGGSAAWIDGTTLRLSGRWAMRLGVEVR